MDIFEIIPDKFFSLLSSKNKRLYVLAIIETFKVYEMGSILGIDKKIVVDDLTHFLECQNTQYSEEDSDSEDFEIESKRDLANFILRRMEDCGWIYIDVTNEYIEILNFSDYAITIIEALLEIEPYQYDADSDTVYMPSKNEYQGYIYTIYSLLNSKDVIDTSMLISQVYSNTKLLFRSLRKLDSRLKDYISSVVEQTEIKDLMEKLIMYKQELVDNTYSKIKTTDNINKFRLQIVSKLEEILNSSDDMRLIALEYMPRYKNDEVEAMKRATRDIDEIIDVFNGMDDYITEIDYKNKTYIKSTIGKIKFLLSEDDNVIGKINTVLKYIKTENKAGHIDKALKTISPLYSLRANRTFVSDVSLYTPRGSYSHNYNQILDTTRFDSLSISSSISDQFVVPYNEVKIQKYLDDNLINGVLKGSDLIKFDTPDEDVLNAIYCVLYVSDIEFKVTLLDTRIVHQKFSMKDFVIERREN